MLEHGNLHSISSYLSSFMSTDGNRTTTLEFLEALVPDEGLNIKTPAIGVR